jgi:hypothetical protein
MVTNYQATSNYIRNFPTLIISSRSLTRSDVGFIQYPSFRKQLSVWEIPIGDVLDGANISEKMIVTHLIRDSPPLKKLER